MAGQFSYSGTYSYDREADYRKEKGVALSLILDWDPCDRDYQLILDIRYDFFSINEWYKRFTFKGLADINQYGVVFDLSKLQQTGSEENTFDETVFLSGQLNIPR